ncbi:MAG: hypothetical protein ACREL7_04110 [Longimicrobiales bacterium]
MQRAAVFDPARARFRTYLRVCLHGFVANELKAASRKKRGGEYRLIPLDFESAEGELVHLEISAGIDPDEFFRQEAIRNLFGLAVHALRERYETAGRRTPFMLFEALRPCAARAARPAHVSAACQ